MMYSVDTTYRTI